MAEDKIIPADILADAKQLFPMYEWSNRSLILPPTIKKSAFGQREEYEAYIRGRLDERERLEQIASTLNMRLTGKYEVPTLRTDEDMFAALSTEFDNSASQESKQKWLKEYKKRVE